MICISYKIFLTKRDFENHVFAPPFREVCSYEGFGCLAKVVALSIDV